MFLIKLQKWLKVSLSTFYLKIFMIFKAMESWLTPGLFLMMVNLPSTGPSWSCMGIIGGLGWARFDQAQESASFKHQTLLVLYIFHPRHFKSKEAYVKCTLWYFQIIGLTDQKFVDYQLRFSISHLITSCVFLCSLVSHVGSLLNKSSSKYPRYA